MRSGRAVKKKLAVAMLAGVIATELLGGCTFLSDMFPRQYLRPLNAVSLEDNGLSLAVWLEDQCESKETDARSLTVLEALHDGLALPTQMLLAISVVTVVGTVWSLYNRITLPASEPLPNRPKLVMEFVKPYRAGPEHRDTGTSHGSQRPIAWSSCLSVAEDG